MRVQRFIPRATGLHPQFRLGSHVGPWYLNAQHTTAFPNYRRTSMCLQNFAQPDEPAHQDGEQRRGDRYSWMVWRVQQLGCVHLQSTSGTEAQNHRPVNWNRDAFVNGARVSTKTTRTRRAGSIIITSTAGAALLLGDPVDFPT